MPSYSGRGGGIASALCMPVVQRCVCSWPDQPSLKYELLFPPFGNR